jgi:hypothetical protein
LRISPVLGRLSTRYPPFYTPSPDYPNPHTILSLHICTPTPSVPFPSYLTPSSSFLSWYSFTSLYYYRHMLLSSNTTPSNPASLSSASFLLSFDSRFYPPSSDFASLPLSSFLPSHTSSFLLSTVDSFLAFPDLYSLSSL